MRIVVLDGYTLNPGDNPWDELAQLGELEVHDRTSVEDVVPRAQGAEILLTNKTPITGQAIARLPHLRFISVLATGYDVVDVKAAAKRGIPVSNVPVYGTDTVAEHVFALVLELARRTALHDQAVKAGGLVESTGLVLLEGSLAGAGWPNHGYSGFRAHRQASG